MKVAIVHEFLTKYGGAERVVKLLSEMFPDAPIYTLFYDKKKFGDHIPESRIITSSIQKKYMRLRKPAYMLTHMRYAIEEFDFSEYDLVISSSSGFTHGLITPLHCKHICYCHAPMRYSWDYTHEYRQEKSTGLFGPVKNFLQSKILKSIRQWDKIAADRPDLYIANSEHVRKRLKKYYKIDAPVIYPPVETKRFKPSFTKDSYFLLASTLTPFKRIDLAIEAFNRNKKTLIILGDGKQEQELKKMAHSHIHFLGRQPDHIVAEYMSNCRALIFPGEDDFGITPVEAMACGKPVIAYKKGGAVETIIENKTGVFFNTTSHEDLIGAISRFIDLERKKTFNPQFIAQHAHSFDEVIFKSKLQECIKSIITNKKGEKQA